MEISTSIAHVVVTHVFWKNCLSVHSCVGASKNIGDDILFHDPSTIELDGLHSHIYLPISFRSILFGINVVALDIYAVAISPAGVKSLTFHIHNESTCIWLTRSSNCVGTVPIYARVLTLYDIGVESVASFHVNLLITTSFVSDSVIS